MKKIILVVSILFWNLFFAQVSTEKEDAITTEVPLSIWDVKNSEFSFKIDTLIYDEIPKNIDFRGTVVTALQWKDALGENILILSKSGDFDWKEYEKSSTTKFNLQDKSEIFTYLFQKQKGSEFYKKLWRIYDFTECFGVDMFAGFKNNATTITDLDNDGIAEITIPYVLFCRGGMDPATMKIILYEGNTKYALRGNTAICQNREVKYGGEYKADEVTQKNDVFYNFLKQRWEAHQCE